VNKPLGKKRKRLGDMLVEEGIINKEQLAEALLYQGTWGCKLGEVFISRGILTALDIASVLEKQLGLTRITLDEIVIPSPALKAVDVDMADKYCIIPVDVDERTITIATVDPTDLRTQDALSFALGRTVKPVLALEYDIKAAIDKYYRGIIEKQPPPEAPVSAGDVPARPQPATLPAEEIPSWPDAGKSTSASEKDAGDLNSRFESLVALLMQKGVLTKEELLRLLK
jgi:hypothetical protein